MLGPLPPAYRIVVAASALLAFVGLGAWVTFSFSGPLLASMGAGVGAAIGVLATVALLHDFSHPHARHTRPARVHTRQGRRHH